MRMILCEIDFKENTNCKSYHNISLWSWQLSIKRAWKWVSCGENIPDMQDQGRLSQLVGTLRSEDRDCEENVTLKVNWWSFGVHRDYSHSVAFSNVGDFSWSWILEIIQVQKDRKDKEKFVLFTSPTKREIRKFCVVVVQWQQRNVQTKCVARAELILCLFFIPIAFLTSSLPSPSPDLRVPYDRFKKWKKKKKKKKENETKREERKKCERKKRKKISKR